MALCVASFTCDRALSIPSRIAWWAAVGAVSSLSGVAVMGLSFRCGAARGGRASGVKLAIGVGGFLVPSQQFAPKPGERLASEQQGDPGGRRRHRFRALPRRIAGALEKLAGPGALAIERFVEKLRGGGPCLDLLDRRRQAGAGGPRISLGGVQILDIGDESAEAPH